jgi:hypothetical protein
MSETISKVSLPPLIYLLRRPRVTEWQVSAALGDIAETMAGSAPVISEVNLPGVKAPEDHEPQPFDNRLGIEPNSGNAGSDRRRAS